MRDALRLTRSGRLQEAGAAIQRALGVVRTPAAADDPPRHADDANVIDVEARVVAEDGAPAGAPASGPATTAAASGRFVDGSFANAAGQRAYKLYIPGNMRERPLPLVVMLHGCTQGPDDFAAGTRMNELAERDGIFVLYPAQTKSANPNGCWNWFHRGHQQRGRGEPSIIADMTREIIATHPVDAKRVYVAGLSAGGAMAAILAGTYPELYAAVGVHSGLAHGAAHDVVSAFAAMRDGPAGARRAGRRARSAVPTIVFHGDRDTTVHPSNGAHVAAQAWPSTPRVAELIDDVPEGAAFQVERGHAAGGHAYTRSIHRDAEGRPTGLEHWVVHGGGHAWFGGSPDGSYTDPQGPDASSEMLCFFAQHRRV